MVLKPKIQKLYEEGKFILDEENSLRFYLEALSDLNLKNIYDSYEDFLNPKSLKRKDNKALEEQIINFFNLLFTYDDCQRFEDSNEILNFMIEKGFAFKKNDKIVVPKELGKIYFENTTLDSDYSKEFFTLIFTSYQMLNGLFPVALVDQIIKEYAINISKETALKEIEKLKYASYNDKFFKAIDDNDKESIEAMEELYEKKEKSTYRILNNTEISTYFGLYEMFIFQLSQVLKTNATKLKVRYMFTYLYDENSAYDSIDELSEKYKLNKKKREELTSIICEFVPYMRFWVLNGRTIEESNLDDVIEQFTMDKKPKDSLQDCLKGLSDNALNELKSYNDLDDNSSVDELCIEINKSLDAYFTNCSKNDLEIIILSHEDVVDYIIDCDDILSGFMFPYRENDKVKLFVPKEIRTSIEKELSRKPEDEDIFDNDFDIESIVQTYIYSNGIIEKSVLQNLLKENHDYDISIKELDNIAKDSEILFNKDYYTILENLLNDDSREEILKAKKDFGKYKKAEYKMALSETLCVEDLSKVLENCDEAFLQEITTICLVILHQGLVKKDIVDTTFEHYKFKKEQMIKITDIMKKYKNDFPQWSLNGYSLKEVQELRTSKKVGRNDPCPCGSGKKYKNCCGK